MNIVNKLLTLTSPHHKIRSFSIKDNIIVSTVSQILRNRLHTHPIIHTLAASPLASRGFATEGRQKIKKNCRKKCKNKKNVGVVEIFPEEPDCFSSYRDLSFRQTDRQASSYFVFQSDDTIHHYFIQNCASIIILTLFPEKEEDIYEDLCSFNSTEGQLEIQLMQPVEKRDYILKENTFY